MLCATLRGTITDYVWLDEAVETGAIRSWASHQGHKRAIIDCGNIVSMSRCALQHTPIDLQTQGQRGDRFFLLFSALGYVRS